jgi:hypothetical protein
MPNRILKESILTSETIDRFSLEEERLFFRLIVNCEDYGRMEAKPAIVRAKCFPLKLDAEGNFTIKLSQIVEWLYGLTKQGTICIYENKGKYYLQFLNWVDHQQTRALKPKYPSFDDEESTLIDPELICNQLISNDSNGNQHNSAPYTNTNTLSITNTDLKDLGKDLKRRSKEDLKVVYGENKTVMLTPDEYIKLVDKFGEPSTKEKIEELDLGIASKGYKYKSHYATILNWNRRENKSNGGLPQKPKALAKLELMMEEARNGKT